MIKPPHVISIQSQVVFGHVGNSAAVFPMQAAGLEVSAIPTVIFSNTPHYPTLRGAALTRDLFADLIRGAHERDLPKRADYIISGYIGSVEVAELTADFIAEVKVANPGLSYICDPVMGDSGPGLYVPEAIADVMRDRLLPMADVATPNQFELGWLTDMPVTTMTELTAARGALGIDASADLIVSGAALQDTPQGHLESIILGKQGVSRHPTPHLPIALSGTGDLYTALITAGLGRGRSLPHSVDLAQRLTAMALQRASDLGAMEIVLSDPEFLSALLNEYGALERSA